MVAALRCSIRVLSTAVLLVGLAAPVRMRAEEGPSRGEQGETCAGSAITPAFAETLYKELAPLRESDGCQLTRFDTGRCRITIGLQAPAGAEHVFDLASALNAGESGQRVGGWALVLPPDLGRDCGATLAAVERVLAETRAPRGAPPDSDDSLLVRTNYAVLAASFVLLVLGTAAILVRETRSQRPSPSAIVALFIIWAVALSLRLYVSPRTFLHEYYHIAETLSLYLTGRSVPLYGDTGPALFRFVSTVLGRPYELQVVFLTNAVLSSLAIPAVALFDLALIGSWPHALCAAALLCFLPQHLRFSAAEDLFVQAVTLGMWALGLFALYLRTRRVGDALLSALALSLAMQTRPEMIVFPAMLVMLVVLLEKRWWRLFIDWRTLLAASLLALLLVPRFLELGQALQESSPTAMLPELPRYLSHLVLFEPGVTPAVYWVFLAIGSVWTARNAPYVLLWVVLLFIGYTLSSLSLFDNPPYDLRSQLLPTSFVVLIAAGAAPVWLALWGRRRRVGLAVGACLLALLAASVVASSFGFVTELRDQQLEWAFLERTVPLLPERATLLSAVETGGRNLDGFPRFLLSRANRTYDMVDVRRAASGAVRWPEADDELIYYQGMYCYFAFADEPAPDPMTPACSAVRDRYVLEPLFAENLETHGYSYMRYGSPPFHIGFFRLRER